MSPSAQFTTAEIAKRFLLAGNARVTLVSLKTGVRFTYRVFQRDEKGPHFVSLLTGPDNTASYTFLGTIFEGKGYRHGRKSPLNDDSPSAKAWAWAWSYLAKGDMPPSCEVWHEGRCGRCGRLLTVPESISTGLGPICEGREAV